MQELFGKIFKSFSSMKTGVLLLALLALFSAVGSTALPDRFNHLILFNILIILLFLNLGICTFNRYRHIWKFLSAHIGLIKRLRQWGLLILHSGLILILIGGMINNWTGQSGTIKLAEGEGALIAEDKTGTQVNLQLEAFEIELYENNMPSQYLSRVSIFKGEELEQHSTISVNNPLRYEGIKVYQQSYGSMVEVSTEGQGQVIISSAVEGQILEIPHSNWRVKVFKYVPDFDPAYGMESKSLQPNNPRIIYSIYQDKVLAGVGAAPFGEKITIEPGYYVEFEAIKPYTVLKVKEDPGLPYTGAGGILFMLGVVLAELNIFSKAREKNADSKAVEE
ncbi:MAG: cytochrome c biogenesis protein ResB [Syntrophomonadaceae bacterium]|jgi:cytochrome c biogenesis protein|nr:cytochrome c biogenesis protein ResB [Syntrophomonadaceae bacterium]